jgi:hypothetical protein
VVKSATSSSFDFGDAAIGAGAAVVVLLAGGGGTLAVHRARHSQLRPNAGA